MNRIRDARGSDAVVSAADIARLVGVRRPAVSNWRRRYSDFPKPVAGTAANQLFSFVEVEAWCDRHRKPFEAGPADRLWQRAQATVDSVRMADFLAHAGMLLVERPACADLLGEPDPRWRDLLTETARAGGEFYRSLCARYGETYGRRGATTSDDVAALMVALSGVEDGTTVLDPACGTGSLLTAASERGAGTLLAQERDPALGHIALARLLLAGRRSRLAVGDALRDDGFRSEDAVDAVLCDPPFRDRHWGRDELAEDARWRYGLPPRGESELAWVQHCLARVRPGGLVVILMPAAAAHRRSGRRVRANLLRSAALRAVIEVPAPSEETHLWVLRAPEPGERPAHLLSVSGAATAEEIVAAWAAFDAGDLGFLGGHGTAVPVVDLLDEETDLRPATHRTAEPHGDVAVEFASARAELDAALASARRALPALFSVADPTGPATTVAALVESGALELHRAPLTMRAEGGPRSALTPGDVRRGGPATGWSQEEAGLVALRAGDVVVTASGARAAPRLVAEAETGTVLGPRLVLLRPVGGRIDPGFLAAALACGVDPGPRGSGAASGRSDVRDAPIPILSTDRQRTYGAALHGLAETEKRLRRAAELGERLARLGRTGLRDGALSPEEPTHDR